MQAKEKMELAIEVSVTYRKSNQIEAIERGGKRQW